MTMRDVTVLQLRVRGRQHDEYTVQSTGQVRAGRDLGAVAQDRPCRVLRFSSVRQDTRHRTVAPHGTGEAQDVQ